MGFYIGANGEYHEGDKQPGDTAVPQRPSPEYTWNGSAWVISNIILASDMRKKRDDLLSNASWRIARYWSQSTAGLPTTETAQVFNALLQYAQNLRDVPQQAGFPATINWPIVP